MDDQHAPLMTRPEQSVKIANPLPFLNLNPNLNPNLDLNPNLNLIFNSLLWRAGSAVGGTSL
jgi:hypothetical protein